MTGEERECASTKTLITNIESPSGSLIEKVCSVRQSWTIETFQLYNSVRTSQPALYPEIDPI